MLTAAQIKKYGPLWGQACRANDWRMERGRLVGADTVGADTETRRHGDTEISASPHLRVSVSAARSPWHAEVWSLAETHALQQHRSSTVEDLRRACNHRVAGKFCSTYDLTNSQFTQLLALFRLLIDPSDIDAQLDFNDPTRAEERWLDRTIERLAPDAYIAEITLRMYDSRAWRTLEVKEKRNLRRILAERRKKWHMAVDAKEPELDPENAPF